MKTIRVWLLLLLVVLLPLRGALAAGVLCPVSGPAPSVAHGPAQPAHGHAAAAHAGGVVQAHPHRHGDDAGQAHAHEPAHDSASPNHDGADGCSICAAACSVPAMLASTPQLGSQAVTTPVASHPAAAASGFITDGLERPPRST